MKTFVLLLFFLLPVVALFAQGELVFKELSHDFGQLPEGRAARYVFWATNTGKQPLLILQAQPSCGCTVSEFTKEPIAPGQSGQVTAIYNTAGRPGGFNKSITVMTNGKTPTFILSVKGTVVPNSQMPEIDEQKRMRSPLLVAAAKQIAFGQAEKGKPISLNLRLKNQGQSGLRVSQVSSGCNCVSYKLLPAVVMPGDSATLELQYTPRTLQTGSETITIFSNDLVHPRLSVQLKGEVVESLVPSNMVKEEKAKPPF